MLEFVVLTVARYDIYEGEMHIFPTVICKPNEVCKKLKAIIKSDKKELKLNKQIMGLPDDDEYHYRVNNYNMLNRSL